MQGDIDVALVEEKMIENWLRWFRHIQKRLLKTLVRVDSMIFNPLDGDQKEHWKGLLKEIP